MGSYDDLECLNSNPYSQYVTFSFYGNSLRLIDYVSTNRVKICRISFNGGKSFERFSQYGVVSSS